MEATIRVLIIDHEPFTREALKVLLGSQQGFEVVGDAGNILAARRLVGPQEPDVCCLHADAPDLPGGVVCEVARWQWPRLGLAVYVGQPTPDVVAATLRAKSDAIIAKASPPTVFVEGVHAAALRRSYVDPALDGLVTAVDGGNGHHLDLTEAELRVLRLLAGRTNAQIATLCMLSPATVKSHVSSILNKLDANDRAHAVAIAISEGLITAHYPAKPRAVEEVA